MIDLHTHSNASDGSYAPERLIERALETGLAALALTDHDTLAGIESARRRADGTRLLFIPGVEIEIESRTGEFHLLGLDLTGDCAGLEEALVRIRTGRHDRNALMVEKLQHAGVPITLAELSTIAGGDIVSRAHFARLLVQKKVVGSIDAAFRRYIGKEMEFYVPRACLGLGESVALIRRAGGVAVIAHPVSLGMRGPALRSFVMSCRDQGVSGVEAWHPNQSLEECRKLDRMARGLGMLVTGGSDFHGEHVPLRTLGRTSGGREVPDSFLEALAAAVRAAGARLSLQTPRL